MKLADHGDHTGLTTALPSQPAARIRSGRPQINSLRNSTIRVATFAGPGAEPVIRSVEWPKIPKNAALIQIGACGVCGTDLHILKGHWPKPLPWPFTLGHEIGGVIVTCGTELAEDFMGKPIGMGSKVMIPP